LALFLLDIDRFKRLNDTFGHQVGDAALQALGAYLRTLAGERCFVARYGGEEFAVILNQASALDVRRLGEEMRLKIQQLRIPVQERQIGFTVSIGAAMPLPGCGELNPATLIALADKCLYRAKESGRNRVVAAELTPKVAQAARRAAARSPAVAPAR
jgi:diguanylate cyclase (GGDEF)-like protein